MKHWYQKPNQLISEYIRTVLIVEGFSESDTNDQPIFTNGMPALFCKTEKDISGTFWGNTSGQAYISSE